MNTFKLGKQTQLVNKVQLSEELFKELQMNLDAEKRKKEAEAAKEKQRIEQQLKEEKEALAKKVSSNKQSASELVLKADKILDEILKCYVGDLNELQNAIRSVSKYLVKVSFNGEECYLDFSKRILYKFKKYDHISKKDILVKLAKLGREHSDKFEMFSKGDTSLNDCISVFKKISGTTFSNAGRYYFPIRTENNFGMCIAEKDYMGFAYISTDKYSNVVFAQKRKFDQKKDYVNILAFLIGEKILPIMGADHKVFSQNGILKYLLDQLDLGLGGFFKEKNYISNLRTFLLLDKDKLRRSLDQNNEIAVKLVSSYPPVANLWKEYDALKTKLNELNGLMEVDEKLSKQAAEKEKAHKTDKPLLSEADKASILEKGLEEYLLESEWRRAHLAPFASECLTDVKQGHWDLFEMAETKGDSVPLKQMLVARPPQLDIDVNMVCGIDFGTKSTVVACRRDADTLLRVGCGELDKIPDPKDYENPTILEFLDFESFKKSYQAKAGRPFTKWKHAKAAHGAQEDLLLKNDANAYRGDCFVADLKQWAGDKNHRLSIDGKLKAYDELQDSDLDPIEVYAYYLGLYINRMLKGICLHYAMSFPVTFSEEAKKHLVKSFKKGLWKSIPESVQKEEGVEKLFKVYPAASEPAAYAACMFKSHKNILPKSSDAYVSYGVFDFGGGTTDFDFGILNKIENPDGRSCYQMTHFGSRGNQYLGGENLLALIGYEIYRENWKEMLNKKIPIILPAKAEQLAGLETLVQSYSNYSSSAYVNVKLLSEALRPIWERPEEKFALNSKGKLEISLWNTNGKLVKLELSVNLNNVNDILVNKIKDGVENFFRALRATKLYAMDSGVYKYLPVHIFLAGNSCKSNLLQQVFEERKLDEEKYLGDEEHSKGWLIIHKPLAEEVDPQQYATQKTCKTGVAFGLLECYKGARRFIVKSEENNGFKYYIGVLDDDDEFKVLIPAEELQNDWKRYIMLYNDDDGFELYFSSEPRSGRNSGMFRADVQRAYLSFDNVQANVQLFVWLRKKSPTCLEYSIGTESQPSLGAHSKIYEVDLSVR